ncbi:glycosyl transferase, family 9 [Thermosinus carboxydivorans Nor1]|uniref:Glycosyl transferase, family 9 n=1 Tax=Thermosinus carboxydivorans Nor1 TaxID=401526 RepID=A1HRG4_9FIRM|nr:glycosyl transferase, family 9 [Thermosinus carboxydivorans Nor1]
MSTSAVALLRQAYPQAKVTMMVRPAAADIVRNNPVIDDIIVYDYTSKYNTFWDMLNFIRNIRQRKFDLSVSFDRKLRPALIALLAGIPIRVGPDRIFDDKPSYVTRLFTHTVHIPHDIINTHQSENYQAIVRGFFGVEGLARPVMGRYTDKNINNADSLINLLPRKKYRIALCVKGTFKLKNWPQDYFAQLVDELAARYDAAFFIIGAHEDREYADEIINRTKTFVANFCGRTTLLDLAALLTKADLFITVDTGAMHIASAIGIPLVAIFGCTSPNRWRPLNNKSAIHYASLPCSPCAVSENECQTKECLTRIRVEDVLQSAANLLESRANSEGEGRSKLEHCDNA